MIPEPQMSAMLPARANAWNCSCRVSEMRRGSIDTLGTDPLARSTKSTR